jgi:carbonic anhydrase/acetyltransferase-like protein (isoleucine patch superfamily)
VLHRAVVRSGALVAAGAVVTPGMEVPAGAMAAGVPAVIRPGGVRRPDFSLIAAGYVANGRRYATELRRVDGP